MQKLSISQVAHLFSVNRSTVSRLVKMGLKEHKSRAGNKYFIKSDIHRFLVEVYLPYQQAGGNIGMPGRPKQYFPSLKLNLKAKQIAKTVNDPNIRKRVYNGIVTFHWDDIQD